jgi:peptide/nickel transport system ATP-binding protein
MGGARRQRVRLTGAIPNAADIPSGCRFHPRCPKAMARCRDTEPSLKPMPDGRLVACHLYD